MFARVQNNKYMNKERIKKLILIEKKALSFLCKDFQIYNLIKL
jgi:hypothetical protein